MPPPDIAPGKYVDTGITQPEFHPLKVINQQSHRFMLDQIPRDAQLLTTASGDRWAVVPPSEDTQLVHQASPFYLNGATEAFHTRQEHVQRAARGLPDITGRADKQTQLHDLQEQFVTTNWETVVGILYQPETTPDLPIKAYKEVGVDDFYVKVDRKERQNNPNPPEGVELKEGEAIENCGRVDVLGITPDGQIVLIDFTTPFRSKSQQLARQHAAVRAIIKQENTVDPEKPAEIPPIHRFKGKYKKEKDEEGQDFYILEFEAPGKKYDYPLATDEEIMTQENKNKVKRNEDNN